MGGARIVDLFARDDADGSLTLIENQLEPANDAHMGQILAYLAGSGAKTLIWIAKDFDARRLDVMRWLNGATVDDYRFFAVRIEILRANGFDIEPRFHVLEAPAAWRRPQSAPVAGASASLGFPASFWAAHAQWWPEEAEVSRQVGPRCRWRPTDVRGVVIGLYVDLNAAEVFLRGRQGVTREAAWEILSPFRARIEEELGVLLNDASCAVLARTRLAIQLANSTNWQMASAWLTTQAQRYDAILTALG